MSSITIGKITAANFCTLEWHKLGIHCVFAELLAHFFSTDSAHWNWKSNWSKGLAQICCPVKFDFEINSSADRFTDALFCWVFFNHNFSFKYCADLCVIKIHTEKNPKGHEWHNIAAQNPWKLCRFSQTNQISHDPWPSSSPCVMKAFEGRQDLCAVGSLG